MIFYGAKFDVLKFATALQLRFGKEEDLYLISRVGKTDDLQIEILKNIPLINTVKSMANSYLLRNKL